MSSSRNSKADRALQEKLQAILSHLLREEDNKYCADCDAKGPRWASWNLGIFVCIRCAGIHRNLGVHISRVKSVNLDAWTDEQVGSMQNMGNSKGRAVYEANLPDGFRRPQSDSSLETFIRSKYEHKKYIAREWVPPTGPQKADFSVLGVPTTGHGRSATERKVDLSAAASSVPRPNSMGNLKEGLTSPTAPSINKAQKQPAAAPTSPGDELFADFISAPLPAAPTATPTNNASLSPDSEEKDFFNQVSSAPAASVNNGVPNGAGAAKIDTASIMSLYAKSPPVQSPLLQHQAGINMGPLNGLTPQMVANNPFLMGGGLVAPQPQLGMPVGYAPPAQLGGINQLGSFGAAVPQPQNAFANQTPFVNPMGMAPLARGAPTQIPSGGMLPQNLIGGTHAANLNLMNTQMSALDIRSTGGVNVGSKIQPSQFKTANGNVLTPNFN